VQFRRLEEKSKTVTLTRDLFAHAMEMHKAGKIEAALASFRKVAAREPMNSPALHWIGYLHNQRGEYDQAVDVLKRAIVERPGVLLTTSHWPNRSEISAS